MTESLDVSRPNIARIYNYWLGGNDNYPADREQAEQLLRIYPGIADAVRENRHFVGRAVTWAAREGIRQFLDLGAGLPAARSVHEMARAISPGDRVVYVDNDPVVISRARDVHAVVDGVAGRRVHLGARARQLRDHLRGRQRRSRRAGHRQLPTAASRSRTSLRAWTWSSPG